MSLARRLIAAGFSDLENGERWLAAPELEGLDQDVLFAGLQLAANPDTALQSLVRLIEKHPDLRKLAAAEPERSEPLYRVLGASEALGEFLIRHPEHLDAFEVTASPEPRAADAAVLRARLLQSVRADPKSARPVAALTGQEGYEALRTEYRRGLVELAVKDLCAADPLDFMPAAGAELADLAGAAIEAALAVSRAEAAEHFSAAEVADVGLAVIGMGKCGARELNYISDVDVIYVIESGELDDSARQHDRHRPGLRHFPGHHVHGPRTRAVGGRRQPAARRASPGRWSGPSPRIRATTPAGPRAGSSRPCSRPAPSPATPSSAPATRPPSRR